MNQLAIGEEDHTSGLTSRSNETTAAVDPRLDSAGALIVTEGMKADPLLDTAADLVGTSGL